MAVIISASLSESLIQECRRGRGRRRSTRREGGGVCVLKGCVVVAVAGVFEETHRDSVTSCEQTSVRIQTRSTSLFRFVLFS